MNIGNMQYQGNRLSDFINLVEGIMRRSTTDDWHSMEDLLDLGEAYATIVRRFVEAYGLPGQCYAYMAKGKKIQAIKELRDFFNIQVPNDIDREVHRLVISLRACKEIIDSQWDTTVFGAMQTERLEVRRILNESAWSGNILDTDKLIDAIKPLLDW